MSLMHVIYIDYQLLRKERYCGNSAWFSMSLCFALIAACQCSSPQQRRVVSELMMTFYIGADSELEVGGAGAGHPASGDIRLL